MGKRQINKKNYLQLRSTKKRKENLIKILQNSSFNSMDDNSRRKEILRMYLKMCIDRSDDMSIGFKRELRELQLNVTDDNKSQSEYMNFVAKEMTKEKYMNSTENTTDDISSIVIEEERTNAKIAALKQQNRWFQETVEMAQILPRPKFHWDYVLAEMTWLAEDFNREKAWKRICAKKLANAVVKSLREKKNQISKDAKKETFKFKKNCANIAKIIKDWWKQMEKIVLAKQQFRLNAKRQEAVTTHLGKVIETTEKYTEWLTEDLNSSSYQSELQKDPDFTAKVEELEDSDNEETIEIDELEIEKTEGVNNKNELEDLKIEADMDLAALLPEEYFNTTVDNNDDVTTISKGRKEDEPADNSITSMETNIVVEDNSETSSSDENSDDDSTDDEDTFIEQELFEDKLLKTNDNEIESLANDANIPVEELLKNYETIQEKEDIDIHGQSSDFSDSGNSDCESSVKDSSSMESLDITYSQILNSHVPLNEDENKVKTSFEFEGEFEALAEAALSTQPKGFTIESADIKVKVPDLIRHTLREYQCVGLDWLAAIYEKRLNGILADEMGLGKTIQTIALLAYMACEKEIWGPHLIIVPTSVILNWDIEFKKWCPGFKILTYFGSAKERRDKRKGWTKTNAFHVCITSYKLAIQDSLSFKRKKWKYLILDEAQNIKNFKSQRWQTLLTFNSQRRLLLTGTPLQNNLMELWSLMHFLMPHIFQSHKEFQEWFGSPLTGMIEGNSEYNEQLVKRLHKVLRPFILRRLKKDVEKQMPKKYEHVIMCKLSKRQRCLYDDFMSLSSTKETLAGGQFLNVINILMQLRKVCNHPNLFETRPTISPFLIINEFEFKAPRCIFIHDFHLDNFDRKTSFHTSGSTLSDMAINLPLFVSQRIYNLKPKPNLIEEIDFIEASDWVSKHKGNTKQSFKVGRNFISQNLMSLNMHEDSSPLIEQPEILINCTNLSFPVRQDQGIKILKKIETIERKSQLPDQISISRKSMRCQTLKYMAQRNEYRCDIHSSYGPDIIDAVTIREVNISDHSYWYSSSLPLIKKKPLSHFFKVTEEIIKRFALVVPPAISNGIRVNKNCQMRQREIRFLDTLLPQMKKLIPHGHFQVLNQQRVQFPDTRLIQYDCGKLQTLEILLKRLHKESHRCLIFTQMTRMLDILEQFLSYLGYRYLRLDGSTKVEQRQLMMEKFNQDSRIFIFILSTRSGGLGINLTGADTVIFYDSDWNPTMDAQAQDRCHRIGQTRDVHIYRLISEMTVEENILKKANQKRTLNDMAIEGGQFNTAFFKNNTLQDLFQTPSGLDDFMKEQNLKENEVTKEKPEIMDSKAIITRSGRLVKWRGKPLVTASPLKPLSQATPVDTNPALQDNPNELAEFEAALEQIEDENDRLAASKAKAEMKADLAEFDETIPWEEIDNTNDSIQNINGTENKESDKTFHLDTERKIKEFQEQLNPIQRYGVKMIEIVIEDTLTDQLETAHQNLQSSKKTWHLEKLKALHEADEMRAEIEEDDMLYCYGNYDPLSQRKELDRLLKEEAEYVREEKRKTDEKVKQDKAEAARKTWSRQQHLLAMKRKHFPSNNHYSKISRTIKQNRILSGSEYPSNSGSLNKDNNGQVSTNPSNIINNTFITPLKQKNTPSFKINPTRQFYPRLRFNYSNPSYYNCDAQATNRPIFHQISKSNIVNVQSQPKQSFPLNKQIIQPRINYSNQLRSFRPNNFHNISMGTHSDNTKQCRPLAMKINENNSITFHNNTASTTNVILQNKSNNVSSMNAANTFINSTQSSIQIPVQSLCNFGTSLPTQQLIINSQPVFFINPQMPAHNSTFLSQVSNTGSQAMIQIVNQNQNINMSQQNRFCNPSLIQDRSNSSRISNILSIPNSQQFFVPTLTRNPTNIIRINCSNSNVSISKPENINHNIISMSNITSPMLRFSNVTNTKFQSPLSNPMIILNNNHQNNTVLSSMINPVSTPIIPNSNIRSGSVNQIISSITSQLKTNNLPN